MSIHRMLAVMLSAGSLVAVLGGCEREGPMERAGKKVDEAVEDLGEATKKEGPVEQTGKKIDKALEQAGDAVEDATNRSQP